MEYTVAFCSSESDHAKEIKMIQMLKQKQVDGLVIAPTQDSKKEIKNLIKEKLSFILIYRYFPDLKTSYVIVDNENGTFVVVERLIDQGHKK